MFEKRKKHVALKLFLIILISGSLGMAAGYASIRYKSLPHLGNIYLTQTKEPIAENTSVTAEPVYATQGKTEAEITQSASPLPASLDEYIVKADEKTVSLFKITQNGTVHFEYTLPINLNALPEKEQKILKEGISVKNKQELASVIEDYGS